MKTKTRWTLLLALVATLAATGLMAQTADRAQRPSALERLDTDGDGVVSRDEFERAHDPFTRLDENGDGVLSEDELEGMRRHRGHRRAHRGPRGGFGPGLGPGGGHHGPPRSLVATRLAFAADRAGDGNGTVTAAEWQSFVRAADADGDGSLTMHELMAVARPQGVPEPPAWTLVELDERFAELDENGDGELAGDELPRRRGPRG